MKTRWKIILIVSLAGNLGILYVARKALEYRSHINEFLEKYTYVVAEFSGRNVYEDANKNLSPDSSLRGRVVFMGTQITARWDLERYFPEYQAVNRGISGQRLAGYLLRIVPDVVELHPRAVVVEFSSYNFRPENSTKEICDYIATLGDIVRANGIKPVFTTVVPVRDDFYLDDIGDYSVPDSLEAYNGWLRAFCREEEHPIVDFFELLADEGGNLRRELSADQIILNDRGYDVISEATRGVLDSLREETP